MLSLSPRSCPLCGGEAGGVAFPYATGYLGQRYHYFACAKCATRYIDPVPDEAAFAGMYAPGNYHDLFYDGEGQSEYAAGAARLAAWLPAGSRVLDYGCGAGHFVGALRAAGLDAAGAEHSAAAAANAAARTGATVFDLDSDDWRKNAPWDCIHLGDVLEHLPNPRATISDLVGLIRPGGLLSVEGPLEANASLVHGAVRLFGWVKHLRHPRNVDEFPPYHLLFTSAKAQRAFFLRNNPTLAELAWDVSETGWPYRRNGALRNAIALGAIALSKLPLGPKLQLGNRFRALYRRTD
jgi:SAM-dependent methyltransferase